MYGDLVVITEVAAFMITIGFFASVDTGATASAFGVSPKPARMSTLSRVTSSCASRLAMSGDGPVVSLTMSSTFRPPNTSPFCFRYVFIPARIWPAVVGERPGELGDDTDLDRFLRGRDPTGPKNTERDRHSGEPRHETHANSIECRDAK